MKKISIAHRQPKRQTKNAEIPLHMQGDFFVEPKRAFFSLLEISLEWCNL